MTCACRRTRPYSSPMGCSQAEHRRQVSQRTLSHRTSKRSVACCRMTSSRGQPTLVLKAAGPPEAIEIHGQLHSTSGRIAVQGHLNTAATLPQYSGTLDATNLNLAALRQQGASGTAISICNSALTASARRYRSGMVRYSLRSTPHTCERLSCILRTLTLRSRPNGCRCNALTLTSPLPIQGGERADRRRRPVECTYHRAHLSAATEPRPLSRVAPCGKIVFPTLSSAATHRPTTSCWSVETRR